ncbi:hypothetical protein V7S43_000156 [Phytophthora oleae]|uniref:Uncharacterized protein n=1 Tax=Phytophthora oleae TaxID=2107226 RepID=A0ABD3G687_9STRA
MLDHGFLSEDIRAINPENSYIAAYSNLLELPEKHAAFLLALMEYTTEHTLLNPNAKSSTRALCVLHVYMVAIKHPMKSDEFKKMFKCNYGTIRTIAMELFHCAKQIEPLFQEYDIAYEGLNDCSEKSKRVVMKRRAKCGRVLLD